MLGSPPGRCPDGRHGGVGMAWARQQPEQHLAIRPPRLRGPCLSWLLTGRGPAGLLATRRGVSSPGPTRTTC